MRARALTLGAVLVSAALSFARESDPKPLQPRLAGAPVGAQAAVNPYEGDAEAVRAGRKLYARHCAECHAEDARGTLRAPALISPSLRLAPSGALFRVLTNGNRRAGMPSWSRLPDARRWQIVAFLKSANVALSRSGHPIPANDAWIASLALQHRLPVLSRDEHFDVVPDLDRQSW
jgi:mono/diheme cytochrome c family protein